MKTLFEESDREEILKRIAGLKPGASRQWGKMTPAQALAHCTVALEAGTGDKPRPQALIGRIFGPFFKARILGEPPFPKNSPTDPTFVVSDEKDFAAERKRLLSVVARFCQLGPSNAAKQTHSFLGRISGEEWGVMMYKHLDHHLRQFGA